MREWLERDEEQRLAPYALRSRGVGRRLPVEDEGRAFDYRTHFQRDRDRIVYSRAFRRLRQKAQVGILPEYEDHRRNRLTHTLEVSQLARTVSRALRLNEDLVEAISLGHDLGQPPFGAAGERALDDLLSGRLDGRGGPGLGDLGGFCRPWQGLHVVDRLEKRYAHAGLNLSDPVREGIFKSGGGNRRPRQEPAGVRAGQPPLFEVQVVVLADRIATALHDLDDALQSGAVDLAAVERLSAVRELRRKLGPGYPARGSRFVKANAIHRGLTHLLVTGAILASRRRLTQWWERHGAGDAAADTTLLDRAVAGDEIGLAPPALRLLSTLEVFLEHRAQRSFEADRVEARGRNAMLGLFAAYHADPTLLETHVLLRFKETTGLRYLRDVPRDKLEYEIRTRYREEPRFALLLADYLAGMTDTLALAEHARLMTAGAVPIPSVEQLRRERT
jgi:dGTPase